MTIAPITPTARREAFDGPEWTFELRFDGFRALADTVNSHMLSKRGNRKLRRVMDGALPAALSSGLCQSSMVQRHRVLCWPTTAQDSNVRQCQAKTRL